MTNANYHNDCDKCMRHMHRCDLLGRQQFGIGEEIADNTLFKYTDARIATLHEKFVRNSDAREKQLQIWQLDMRNMFGIVTYEENKQISFEY